MAVSYTHLDVYKRQEETSSNAQMCGLEYQEPHVVDESVAKEYEAEENSCLLYTSGVMVDASDNKYEGNEFYFTDESGKYIYCRAKEDGSLYTSLWIQDDFGNWKYYCEEDVYKRQCGWKSVYFSVVSDKWLLGIL